MSLYDYIARPHGKPHQKPTVIIAASDEQVKRVLSNWRVIMKDGPVDVQGKLIGWRRTAKGTMGGIFANPLTNRRELWALDFQTQKPRMIAVL